MEEENERKAELEVSGFPIPGNLALSDAAKGEIGQRLLTLELERPQLRLHLNTKNTLSLYATKDPEKKDHVRSFVRDDNGRTAGPHFEGGQHTKPR